MKNQLFLAHPLFTRWLAIVGIAFAAILVPGHLQSLHAQEAEPAAEEAATGEQAAAGEDTPASKATSFVDLFRAGGPIMYPLTVLSMIGVGLVVFNFLNLRTRAFYAPQALGEVREALENLDIERAKEICESNPSIVTNIVGSGLDRIGDTISLEAVEKAMEEASSEELAAPFIYINYLSIVGSVSPMVGMLGTVTGMIAGFRALMEMGMGDPGALAGSISEALITTATGLIIAIPAMIFYFYFKSRYGIMVSRVARFVGDTYYSLASGTQKVAGEVEES